MGTASTKLALGCLGVSLLVLVIMLAAYKFF
jgi:hypothetical protein